MSKQKLTPELASLLNEAVKGDLDNYEVEVQDENAAGQGYLGDMVFIKLRNKLDNEISHLVVKQTLPAKTEEIKEVLNGTFYNEIHFYKNIMKEFENFRKDFPEALTFDNIPKCLAFAAQEGEEKIVMENLKASGFKLFPRDAHFDNEHLVQLLQTYGRFHGTSAAFREHKPEDFDKLTSRIKDTTRTLFTSAGEYIQMTIKNLIETTGDEKINKKLKIYAEEGTRIALDAVKYDGKNPVVCHGDCWSNNFFFKYDENGALLDIKLLDFQLLRKSSVTNDLGYLLYSGARKDILDNLDHYLQIYHNSFSETLHSYGVDPSKVFTLQDLKKEFKDYIAFGFFAGQMVWPTKLRKTTFERRNFVELTESEVPPPEETVEQIQKRDKELEGLKDIFKEITQHLYENGFI